MVRLTEIPVLVIRLTLLRSDLAAIRRRALAAAQVHAGIQTSDNHDAILRGFQAFAYQRAHYDSIKSASAPDASNVLMPIPKALAEYLPQTLLQGRDPQTAHDVFASLTSDLDMPADLADRITANRMRPLNMADGLEQHEWLQSELGIQRRLVALFVAREAHDAMAFDQALADVPDDRVPGKLRRWRRGTASR